VGAGTGLFVECAVRWGFDCKGLEGSNQAIEIARKRCPGIQMLLHLLTEPFPFEGAVFQTVICNQVIEHLEPEVADKCLEEIRRVLRPGGMLFVASPSVFNKAERSTDPTHLHMYSPQELVHLLSSKGFERIIPWNSPRSFFGNGPVERRLMSLLFKLTKWEPLSASASCIAYKNTNS
jgi:2-polyprenyl-3-methyl-5-hydroxy-6-metoxy-1,4-benzoquinol methylase